MSLSGVRPNWTLAALFAAGAQGAWYDPSDLSTLFQDAAGTVAVTGMEQPVGLVKDKSGRGNHASQATAASRPTISARRNLIAQTENLTASEWTLRGTATATPLSATWDAHQTTLNQTLIQLSDDLLTLTMTPDGSSWNKSNVRSTTSRSSGKYVFEVLNWREATGLGTSNELTGFGLADPSWSPVSPATWMGNAVGTSQFCSDGVGYVDGATIFHGVLPQAADAIAFRCAVDFDAGKVWVGGINGWQGDPTTGANPAYTFTPNSTRFISAEVWSTAAAPGGLKINFGQEAFVCDPPAGFLAWNGGVPSKRGAAISLPTGATNATLLTGLGAPGVNDLYMGGSGAPAAAGTALTPHFTVRQGSPTGAVTFQHTGGSTFGLITLDLSKLSGGWDEITPSHPAVISYTPFTLDSGQGAGYQIFTMDGVPRSISVTKIDLRLAADAPAALPGIPAYQRVVNSTVYDRAGFPSYLKFGGTHFLVTGSINFTGSGKLAVFLGHTKLSDTTLGLITELSITSDSNTGTFFIAAPRTSAVNDYGSRINGSAVQEATVSGVAFAAPLTKVLSLIGDIAGSVQSLRANGVQIASTTGSLGTGTFGNYPLYIGDRGGTTLGIVGRISSFVVVGGALSATSIALAERAVGTKVGVVL